MKMFDMMGLKISTVVSYLMTDKTTSETFYAVGPVAEKLHAAGTHTTSKATATRHGHLEYAAADIDWWVALSDPPRS